MKPLTKITTITPSLLMAFALGFFALPPRTQAVSPPPDGGYPGQNTAEGQSALLHLAGGTYNTALGWASLGFNVTGNFNTAVGAATLLSNTGDNNTATGVGALLSNGTGLNNTANGTMALFYNTAGAGNTATGYRAMFNNIGGGSNTVNGESALESNTGGSNNTAIGVNALVNNTSGNENIGLGLSAGGNLNTGDHDIYIANLGGGANESGTIRIGDDTFQNATFIAGISGASVPNGVTVFVNGNGHLGTMVSSARFKEEIKPMGNASEAILALKPVTFRYKKEIDPRGIPQCGLVAEEVEKVNPDLIIRDKEGKPYTVRYEQVNAMLLNEFLKEHAKVEKLEAALDTVKKRLNEQEARIQKVSAEVEVSEPAAKTALNSQ